MLQGIEQKPRLYWLVPKKMRESAQIGIPFSALDKFVMLLCLLIGLIFANLTIPMLFQVRVGGEALFVILTLVPLGGAFVYTVSVKYQLRLLLFFLAMMIGYASVLLAFFYVAVYLLTHMSVLFTLLTIPAAALLLYLMLSIAIAPIFNQKEILKWIIAQKEQVKKPRRSILTFFRPLIGIQIDYG